VILVMGAITIMAIMLSEMQDETASDLSSALSERDALKAEYAARSAINLSRLLISAEPTIRRTLTPLFMMMRQSPPQIPVWEFADQVLGAFGDAEGVDRFKGLSPVDMTQAKNLGLAGAGFELVVVDEDSKLNFNLAARADAFSQGRAGAAILGLIEGQQYNSLFEERDADGQFSTRQDVCSAIVDWADPNTEGFGCEPHAETATTYGPEDSFYQMLPSPYQRKNAAFDSLEELRLVRGMSDDFWATFVEPNPDDPRSRPVTIWGQGATNVNTANAQAILAIVCANALEAPMCTDPEQAIQFLSTVELIRSFTAGAPMFGSPKAFLNAMQGRGSVGQVLAAIGVLPATFRSESEALKTIATESKVFSIVATGYVRQGKRETRVRVHSVVDFRGAPAPAEALVEAVTALTGGGGAASSGSEDKSGKGQSGLPEGVTEEGIAGAFRADPAGKVLYYRIN
jgi:general secretion pathway protein K